ncbi:MAG: hypothetical protein NT080_04445 [Spirochaetes bacterium]|nr:hypothetical protein [Spirochaetota bacterium]
MKRKYLIVAAAAVLIALAGCTLPEYQLGFTIDELEINIPGDGWARVSYTMINQGSKDIYNASIKIEVDSAAFGTSVSSWTSGSDLTVGASVEGIIDIFVAAGVLGGYPNTSAEVIAAGWDDSASN